MRPSYRPHYASCPSVSLSVCLTVGRARNSKTKEFRKIKISIHVPQRTSKWSSNFRTKRSKVKVNEGQKPDKTGVMFTYGRPIKRSWK